MCFVGVRPLCCLLCVWLVAHLTSDQPQLTCPHERPCGQWLFLGQPRSQSHSPRKQFGWGFAPRAGLGPLAATGAVAVPVASPLLVCTSCRRGLRVLCPQRPRTPAWARVSRLPRHTRGCLSTHLLPSVDRSSKTRAASHRASLVKLAVAFVELRELSRWVDRAPQRMVFLSLKLFAQVLVCLVHLSEDPMSLIS